MKSTYDYVIIGGGIVGASTAMQLAELQPKSKILLVEKEEQPAMHQTGHNSGVIHAGVYYAPKSMKADFCKRGLRDTIAFCEQNDIPYDQCGKLIVATRGDELAKLKNLFENSKQNNLDVTWLEEKEMRRLEPNVIGIKGILVKDSAITDYTAITSAMLDKFKARGGTIELGKRVTLIKESDSCVNIELNHSLAISTSYLIACAGLQADRIASMIGIDIDFRIVPFKGEYFKLPASKSNVVKHLIYPVPDPDMPFLGVHLTNMIDGRVTVGPNAVLSFMREGYNKLDFSRVDTIDMISFAGFWKVIFANLKSGIQETKNSIWKKGYLRLVQRYCPSIELKDLEPYPPGVRAQAVMNNGDLVHDFLFKTTSRSLHVCNAPSPAATSAIPIGEHICRTVIEARSVIED